MTDTPTAAIPEQGQLVEVRQLRYIVSAIEGSTLPDSIYPNGVQRTQHLVTLASVEDDALGEEAQVIWELEPGARIVEHVGLPDPDGFDAPRRLDAFLNAVRWGAASSADVRALQAPFRSGIDIEDYQLDPVVRAIQMPRANLLIADDVGLGKTVEAGLVVQEMLIRHRARRVLIVCPAALQVHWHDQMHDKFGLDFRIVNSQLMKELRRSRGIHVNPWTHFPRLITSIDFLKRERPMRLFRGVLPSASEPLYPRRFDILIVDEAHNVAPSGSGKYAVDSLRTMAIRTISPHFEHRLFLTATPHNGYRESFSALLELLDNQRFARGVEPDEEQKRRVMIRRLKSELPLRWDGTPRFPPRVLDAIEVEYTAEERTVHSWLQEYIRLRRKQSGQNQPALLPDQEQDIKRTSPASQRMAMEFVAQLLKKRLLSSPAAFAATLRQHRSTLAGVTPNANGDSPRKPSAGLLRQLINRVDEEYAEDDAYEAAALDAVEAATRTLDILSPRELELLEQMAAWADRAAMRPDSKALALIDWLEAVVRPDGKWTDERVIIFTEYRATQNWLESVLASRSLTRGGRLLTLYGGMQSDEREAVKAAFMADPADSPARILLATDAASEGIDLQRHCHRLIHVEIPWNPNRLEQRNGRIDRHGQRFSPEIYHFVGAGYQQGMNDPGYLSDELEADLGFLLRVALKVDQIREDLGSVGPVIAQQVEAAMLGGERHLYTDDAEAAAAPVRRQLKFERNLRDQIERLSLRLRESRHQLNLEPKNVQSVVEIALDLAGQPPLQPAKLAAPAPIPGNQDKPSPVFDLPALSGSWTRGLAGVAHPYTGQMRPITFDQQVASGRDDVVLAHLNHPLVQMSLRLLRAEVWSAQAYKRLHRATACIVPDHLLDVPAVIAHGRLVVIGGDSVRLHEELIVAGGLIRQGRLERLNLGDIDAALPAAGAAMPDEAVQARLLEVWPQFRAQLLRWLARRQRDRTASLERFLSERAEREVSDIRTVLEELARSIEDELTEPEFVQLELFSKDEHDQLKRNETALRRRLTEIPDEVAQEEALIRARFADPQSRLFPVAVTFLVPARLAHE